MSMWIVIRYKGSKCKACGVEFKIGDRAKWFRSGVAYHKTTWHQNKENGDWIPGACILQPPLDAEEAANVDHNS